MVHALFQKRLLSTWMTLHRCIISVLSQPYYINHSDTIFYFWTWNNFYSTILQNVNRNWCITRSTNNSMQILLLLRLPSECCAALNLHIMHFCTMHSKILPMADQHNAESSPFRHFGVLINCICAIRVVAVLIFSSHFSVQVDN